jgi:tRNA uridine 5-carboxymethylaminomethyl modification enzyme
LKQRDFDVIVIGGGHAGVEAAWAASGLGASTAMLTMRADRIAAMSCNPAIGGLAKGQIVREVDALGGLMGKAIDATGIQFRMLNRRKGPAVWSPRAQADKHAYSEWVRRILVERASLTIVEAMVERFLVEDDRIVGVEAAGGRTFRAGSVVVTTGTFLRGLMHQGPCKTAGGRIGEQAAEGLSGELRRLGFELGRLKTGTPPRILKESIDFDRLEFQAGDDPPRPFSFETDRIDRPQTGCWVTYTNEKTHELIRNNLDRSPMYSGQIESIGPRYCPSIEDKVVRFADKTRHQIFIEPEGLTTDWFYCNGISTSLPVDVQEPLVRSIEGLESARIVQHGYAVEYDFTPPTQLHAWLETKRVEGLYFAGQINGTTGYEEAAGQGQLAGINAARRAAGIPPVVLRRDQAYIGVLVDDLVTKGVEEPYRMFTSRAEYRLHLRSDNADERLTPLGREIGLVGEGRWRRWLRKLENLERATAAINSRRHQGRKLAEHLRRPEVSWTDLSKIDPTLAELELRDNEIEQIEIRVKYEGYIARQERQVERFGRLEQRVLPAWFDFNAIPELRIEARQKLSHIRPATVGQAARISGVNPADITVLLVYLDGKRRQQAAASA